MSSGSVGQAAMLRDIQQHIRQLEQAISGVNSTRKHLQQSAMAVKSDIKMTITQQLETLRARELHLLQQVDLAQQAKDAALQGQEDQLHETLGALHNMLSLGEAQGHGQVYQTLAKLKNLNISPKEAPYLAFRSSVNGLTEEINNFGHVDLQRLPVSALFDKEPVATSLPRPFEDYNDEEHHVLYRPISTTGAASTTRQISVTIPRLSKKPEDWLFMPSDQLTRPSDPSPTSPTPEGFPRTVSANFVDWLDNHDELNRSVSSAASIQQWLCDIQGQGDVEEAEAEFEVISPPPCQPASTKGSSIEVLSMEEVQPIFVLPPCISDSLSSLTISQDTHRSLPYFEQVKAGTADQWLLGEKDDLCSSADSDSSASYCDEVLTYFREVSNDTKDWLLKYTEKKKEVQPESCVSTATCGTVTGNIDIENLAQLVCVHDPVSKYFKEVASDSKRWLLSQKDEDGDCDEMEMDDGVGTVCKANEPCQSFQECVSDENCCSMLQGKCHQNLGSTSAVKFDYFDSVIKQKGSAWLLTSSKVVDPSPAATPPSATELFAPFTTPCHIRSWLLSAEAQAQDANVPFFGAMDKILKTPVDQWLTNPETSSTNDLNKCDLQSVLTDWSSRFSHKMTNPDSPTHNSKHDITKPNPCPDNQWLYSNPNPYQCPDDLLNIKADLFSQGGQSSFPAKPQEQSKTLSWLLNTDQMNKEGHMVGEKRPDFGKQSELPECEDEPGMEMHSSSNGVMFACFQKEFCSNQWLAAANNYIE